MLPRERVLETARKVYRSYGFAPIDTPALEYAEVLLGKGAGEENERLVYRFRDHGDRDVALRFDLTVPFARFAAQHVPPARTPFRRYAMGPVWRGENTSAGRYREFWQCDFDDRLLRPTPADAEAVLVISDLFTALGTAAGRDPGQQPDGAERAARNARASRPGGAPAPVLDKLGKIGPEKVARRDGAGRPR
jgi:histidyl-tRNA synthetase